MVRSYVKLDLYITLFSVYLENHETLVKQT